MAYQDFNPNVNSKVDPQFADEVANALRRIRKALNDIAVGGGASSYAPATEAFVTIGNTANLSDERALAVGGGGSLALADGGANSSATLTRAALTGDVTASADSNTTTLASILTAGGPTGSSTVIPIITWDAKGRLTAVSSAAISSPEYFTARSTQAVVAGTAISVTDGSPVTPITITGDTTMTAAPTIAAGRNGQLVILINDDATSTDDLIVSDAGVLSGSLLRLGASTRTLTPGATLTLIYDSVIGAWVEQNFNTLVTITPAILTHTINIGSGAASSQNAEVAGSGTHTPTFAWTYTGVPSAGTVDVSSGGDPGTDYPATILTPFTSLVGPAFNKGTSVGTVRTFTPSITVNGSSLTSPTATVTYINRRYAGPNTSGAILSSANVLNLDGSGGTSDLSTSQYGTFSVTAGASDYIYYAHRSALTAISSDGMSIDGEICGFTDLGTMSHTNDSGFTETFRQYVTTIQNAGAVSLVTASSRRNNRIFMGPHTSSDLSGEASPSAEILTLDDTGDGESIVSSTVARTYSNILIDTGEYLWFCHPDAISDLATIKDGTTGFAIAGSYQTDVSFTNAKGYTETYRCWRSDNTGIYPSGEDVVVT